MYPLLNTPLVLLRVNNLGGTQTFQVYKDNHKYPMPPNQLLWFLSLG